MCLTHFNIDGCSPTRIRGLTNDKLNPGFYLLDQYGEPTQTTTSLHKEAKEFVWARLKAIVEAGKSLASKAARKSSGAVVGALRAIYLFFWYSEVPMYGQSIIIFS